MRDEQLGPYVVLRGVIEITNVCRVNCDYCPMRRDNLVANDRYFMDTDTIVHHAHRIRDHGIDVILLQGGETTANLENVQSAIPKIRELYNDRVEVLLNIGNMSREQYARLRRAGALSYILKHETSDPELHERIRKESLESRLRCMRDLLDLGYKVGTGLISGLPGQGLDSIVRDIELAGTLGVHMCSVSPFVPAPDTPFANEPPGSLDLALNVIACLRICYPHLLIPSVSALEKTEPGGQSRGLAAGANVMTTNFTSDAARDKYLIYGKERFVARLNHIREVVARAGLTPRGSMFIEPPAERDTVRAG